MTGLPHAIPGENVVVIGAGVVGCATALTLARAGLKVTVLDPGPIAGGASYGNSGAVFPQAYPLAQPGMPGRLPGMLADPNGPLTIHPAQMVKAFPWFLKFLRECLPSQAEANSKALYALAGQSGRAWKDLLKGTPVADLPRSIGWTKVYSTEKAFDAAYGPDARERRFFDKRGEAYDILTADELHQMEPALARIFPKAVFFPNTLFMPNPQRLTLGIAEAAKDEGVTFLQEAATSLITEPSIAVETADATHPADWVIVCAGAFSKKLAKDVDADPALEAERGYHAMFDTPERGLNRQVLWVENNMVLCPMEHGVRLTTQSEFAGLNAPANYTRINRLAARAKDALPSLDTTIRDRWMGRRPSTPDSLPYLGPSPRTPRVWFNFGHNHLGLTLAAISAEIVSGALRPSDSRNAGLDLSPYRAMR